jgi:hypothetical protein
MLNRISKSRPEHNKRSLCRHKRWLGHALGILLSGHTTYSSGACQRSTIKTLSRVAAWLISQNISLSNLISCLCLPKMDRNGAVQLDHHTKPDVEESVHDVISKDEPRNGYSDAYVRKRGLDVRSIVSPDLYKTD